MKTIQNYISILKKIISSLNGDEGIAEEYESQIILEFEDFKSNFSSNNSIIDEKRFVKTLEDPKSLARSLLGIKINEKQDWRINLFSKNDWVTIGNSYILFYISWIIFNMILASIFIYLGRDIRSFRQFSVPFGYLAILSLYFWPIIYLIYKLSIGEREIKELDPKHLLIELSFLFVNALIGHYILVEIHNSLEKYVQNLSQFIVIILVPLLFGLIISNISSFLLINNKYRRVPVSFLIPTLSFILIYSLISLNFLFNFLFNN